MPEVVDTFAAYGSAIADRRGVLGSMVGAATYGGAVRLLGSADPAAAYAEWRAMLPGQVQVAGPALHLVRRRRVTVEHRSSQPEPPNVGYRDTTGLLAVM